MGASGRYAYAYDGLTVCRLLGARVVRVWGRVYVRQVGWEVQINAGEVVALAYALGWMAVLLAGAVVVVAGRGV